MSYTNEMHICITYTPVSKRRPTRQVFSKPPLIKFKLLISQNYTPTIHLQHLNRVKEAKY
jgi:hypothetical protein